MASNSLGTLSSALILQQALELVNTKRPILNRISLDLKADQAKLNQTVYSRIYSVPSVTDFGDAASASTATDVPVTLDKWKQVLHTFTAAELTSTDRNLVAEAAEPVAVAIANHLVDAVAALWTSGNFSTAVTETVANSDYETLVNLRKKLVLAGAPDKRFAAVNADVYEKFLADNRIVQAYSNAKSEAINTGVISAVAGFDVFEYPACPTTSYLTGFAGAADSCVLATRLPRDPREVLPNAPMACNWGVITEPRTGLSVLVNEWIGTDLSANVRLCWLYGIAKGKAASGVRLITQ